MVNDGPRKNAFKRRTKRKPASRGDTKIVEVVSLIMMAGNDRAKRHVNEKF